MQSIGIIIHQVRRKQGTVGACDLIASFVAPNVAAAEPVQFLNQTELLDISRARVYRDAVLVDTLLL